MAELTWAPVASRTTAAVLMLNGTTEGGTLHLGDGKSRPLAAAVPVVHDYGAEGTYRARVVDSAGSEVAATQVVVRDAVPATFAASAEPGNENVVEVSFTGTRAAQVSVDYGDGSEEVSTWAVPGGKHSKAVAVGSYTGILRDLDARRFRKQDYEVTGPVYDPSFTVSEDTSDPQRRTAVLELTAVDAAQGEVTIDWGYSGASEAITNPQVGDKRTHAFDPDDSPSGDGVFFVMAYYTNGAGNPAAVAVSIPFTDE